MSVQATPAREHGHTLTDAWRPSPAGSGDDFEERVRGAVSRTRPVENRARTGASRPETRTAACLRDARKLRDRDSNPKFDIQSVACCQLHHPGPRAQG